LILHSYQKKTTIKQDGFPRPRERQEGMY
jgi:hypothetical protein